ncbi:MAG: FG-GAP repeat protein [Planctomycetes bacterium]|nr:FG-GAP repeat protein [Planctomycetota bacterium]
MRPRVSRATRIALVVFTSIGLVSASRGQESPWIHHGSAGDGVSVVAPVGDVDSDGVDDVLVGAPSYDGDTGRARLLSGADGSVLATFVGDDEGDLFGAALAGLGDVDDDGTPDFAIGAPGDGGIAGYVDVYSGDDHTLLFSVSGSDVGDRLGAAVGGLGDVDSDGHDDLLVGIPGDDTAASDAGAVWLLSGDDGSLLDDAFGSTASDGFGASIAVWPAWKTWSGHDPLPGIGAPQAGTTDEGYFVVLDPSDMSVVRTRSGTSTRQRLGTSVAFAGDVDGDGWLDHVIGDDPRDSSGDPTGQGTALVVSGDDGDVIHTFTGTGSGERYGSSVAGTGDVDGDGRCDVIVAAPASSAGGSGAGEIRVYSGASGALLKAAVLGAPGDAFGTCAVLVGDVDGDDLDDLFVSAPGDDSGGTGAGAAWMVSFTPWGVASNGVTGTCGVPLAKGRGGLLPGTQVTITLEDVPAYADVILVSGTSTVVDPSHGVLGPTPDVVVSGLSADANGELEYEFTWPSGASTGDVFFYQWRVDDSGASNGESLSNTIKATVP